MSILSSFNKITTKARDTIKSFPVTLVWAIIGTFFTLWLVNQNFDRDTEFKYLKIVLTFILGVSWLIAIRLLINYFKTGKNQRKPWLIIIPLIFLALYYFSLPNNKEGFNDLIVPYRFVLFLVTGHLLIFFSPFLFIWAKKAYWNYLKNIFVAFATSLLFSLVLYLGLIIALTALKYLFGIEIKGIRYFELFIFCLGIVNTWIFLAGLPKDITKQTTLDYPKELLIFVKYLLIPLTLLYLVILYAYSFKILLNWDLPKGWVSYLVVALSVLGFIIHILINPIQKTTESRVIKRFYPWFYYALLPMIILLFVAIFKRISDYGFTENRYLILLLALWIFGMTLYILFSKRKKISYFPMSVSVLTVLVSFGFWGVFSVSKNSQAKQFEKLFTKMEASNFKVKSDEKYRFKSIARYLVKRNASEKISAVLGYNITEAFDSISNWSIPDKLVDTLGIKITDFGKSRKNNSKYFSAKHNKTIHIKGYDYLKQIYFDNYNRIHNKKIKNDNTINGFYFELDSINRNTINLIKEKDTLYKIDLKPLLITLEILPNNQELKQEQLTINSVFKDLEVVILFQSLGIKKEGNQISITNSNATVLLKEKAE